MPCRETPLTAWGLLKDTVSILYKSFWPLILIFAATDVTMYALHRVSHRITNQGKAVIHIPYLCCSSCVNVGERNAMSSPFALLPLLLHISYRTLIGF